MYYLKIKPDLIVNASDIVRIYRDNGHVVVALREFGLYTVDQALETDFINKIQMLNELHVQIPYLEELNDIEHKLDNIAEAICDLALTVNSLAED